MPPAGARRRRGRRQRREVVLAHPAGRRTGTSDSQNSRCRFAHRIPPLTRVGHVQHVVVVVPVDAEEHEAQHVAQERPATSGRSAPGRAVRDLQLEHHDRDEDRDHAVAEGFEPSFAHRREATPHRAAPRRIPCAARLGQFRPFLKHQKTTMTTPVTVTKFEVKSHDSPDEVRAPNKTRVEVIRLEGFTLGRIVLRARLALVGMREAGRQDRPRARSRTSATACRAASWSR